MKVPDETIHLFYPYIPKEAIDAVSEVLRSRWIGQGPKVEEFEKKFSNKFRHRGISMSSGTAALETAYELCGFGPGDEVITTPFTCSATNLMILKTGAKIVWADILPDTFCIDPADIARKITNKTKAIVQVHVGGLTAKAHELMIPNIPVISDAAQALGTFVGDYTCCSFQAIKHITTGDGGMLIC